MKIVFSKLKTLSIRKKSEDFDKSDKTAHLKFKAAVYKQKIFSNELISSL